MLELRGESLAMELTQVQHRFLLHCALRNRLEHWHSVPSRLLTQKTAIALVKKGILEAIAGQDRVYQFTPTGMKLARNLIIEKN